MIRPPIQSAQRGFTLVEAIIVIVIIGVLGAVVAVFIRMPVQGYADSVARAELTDQADLALRRIARDLRLALPNSVRVSNDGSMVEFLITRAGGRYLSAEDNLPGQLDFDNTANTTFTVAAPMPGFFNRVAVGDFVVVYNLGEGLAPSDAWQFAPPAPTVIPNRNIAQITGVNTGTSQITLADNPFAAQSPPMPSPSQRFQVLSGPVTYRCADQGGGRLVLTRHWAYPITAAQQVPPAAAQSALLATGLARCNIFAAETAATQRSALVILTLELLARNAGDASIRLVHQVHVDNTP